VAALAVKAVGLASPLGGLVQACAAHRAVLTRPSPAPDVEVMFPGDEEPQAVNIHALPSATFGFSGVGRLVALLAEALIDLARTEDLSSLGPDTGFFLALPDPLERGFGLARGPEDDEPEEAEARVAALGERVLRLAATAAGLSLPPAEARYFGGGHVAFAHALAMAHRAVAERLVKSALVCAVDSLASPECLDLFATDGRVKNGDSPSGFIPGEAAVVAFLAPPGRAAGQASGQNILVGEPAFESEPAQFGGETPSDGRALAKCLTRALGPASPGASAPVLVSDHDGESHRARELGVMKQRLMGLGRRELAEAATWLPAISFGNTGAASGAVALALAHRALVRSYAPVTSLALLLSDDAGARASLVVSQPA
jgi:3-oxoacyl-(acyl-carrier-protein) synthase